MLTQELYQNQSCLRLRLPHSNNTALIALHGAQVLSWQTDDERERLFLSPRAVFDVHTAIRGGVPICFPQFNQRGPLPKHGFVRNYPWQVVHQTSDKTSSTVTLQFSETRATLALWPHRFVFNLTLTLMHNGLEIKASVTNSDQHAWDFALALHSYLRVNDISHASLDGLKGAPKWDAVRDVRSLATEQKINFTSEFDSVFDVSALSPIDLRLEQKEQAKFLKISHSTSMSECVVWNPGAALCAKLGDMAPDSYQHMLCVEAAKIDAPVTLQPAQTWQGSQRLFLSDYF
jgi:glucose-6-phosphate 1-epimerase